MRAVLQRVNHASVFVGEKVCGAIGRGFLALLGIGKEDGHSEVNWMAEKILNLRVFPDEAGKMNRSLADVKGEILVVSQFTLYGDCSSGRRPGYSDAATPENAKALYEACVEALRKSGLNVETGIFQAHMKVSLENDGPVTFILDSKKSETG